MAFDVPLHRTVNNYFVKEEYFMTGKSRFGLAVKVSVITLICIALNVGGDIFTDLYSVPAMMDSFGTIFAAYIFGPICGAVVGFTSSIIMSFWNNKPVIYCLSGIIVGLCVGIAARRKFFDTLFHAMSITGIVTIVSVIFSTILNAIYFDTDTGNVLGDGVRDFFMVNGMPKNLAAFIGQLYLEFTDKLVSIVGVFYVIQSIHAKKSKIADKKKISANDRNKTLSAIKSITALFLIPAALSFLCEINIHASADNISDSESSSYIRKIYNGDNGLSCGHANDVVQTKDGILWAGSYSGLYRYNGNTFRHMDEFDSVKNVNCLFVDTESRLWIGTNDNGVVLSIHEKIMASSNDYTGLPNNSVRSITQSSDGLYYIGTSDKMAVARLETGIHIIKTLDDVLFAKSSSADDNGNVAVTTGSGKIYILREGDVVYEIISDDTDVKFTCCTFGKSGELFAGTADGHVLIYNVGEKSAECSENINCESLSGLNNIYISDNDVVWVLSDNGVGTIHQRKNFEHLETEGFNYSLEKMVVDYQGNLWIASSRMGLMQLSASPFTDIFAEYGLEQQVVNTTALKDNYIYIGMDGGLSIIDTANKKIVENELTKLLSDTRVRCIIKDSSNNLWICSYSKGLIKVKSNGDIVRFDGEQYGIGSRVRVCMELSDGSVIVGGDLGLYFIKDEQITGRLIFGEDMGAAEVLCIYEYPDGTVLAGTDGNGIAVIKDKKVVKNYTRDDGLTSDVILRMVGDLNKNDVFVSTGNGLCYLKNDKINEFKNFPYSNNFDLILDDDGDIFVTGSSGIYVCQRENLISGRNLDYIVLNSKVGLIGSLTSNAWNAIDENKNAYFSTDRGVFSVNLDAYKTKRRFYRLMIPEILLDGKSFLSKNRTGIIIEKDVKSIELVPEIVNYTLENPTISYKLEGLDDSWKSVSQTELSHIVYTNLPAGEYEFRLAILDPETGKSLEECSYSFEKERAIYDNKWFIVYMIAFGGLFIGWLTWFITRMQMQRTLEIQQAKLSLALQQVKLGNETILAIAKTVDAKDVRTSQHSQRVSEYTVKIAEKCGFDEEELENIRKSALLHDIGKIGIPDAILNKPSRLTYEEYKIMKTHVMRGAEILKEFTLVKHADDGARYHHERYDGKGYPDHLSGKDIPLYGRIIAIADAFDAMTANRIYRKRQDFDYVMNELRNGRGTQFDPELLDIFLGLIESGEINIEKLYSKDEEKGDDGNNENKS